MWRRRQLLLRKRFVRRFDNTKISGKFPKVETRKQRLNEISQIYQKADAFARATHCFIVFPGFLLRNWRGCAPTARNFGTTQSSVCSHMFFGLIWRRVAVFFVVIVLLLLLLLLLLLCGAFVCHFFRCCSSTHY